MKFSRLEKITLCLTALALAFLCGWFSSRQYELSRQFVPVTSGEPSETVSPVPSPSTQPEPEEEGLININTATREELMMLPGIGEKRADDIIAHREANGPFLIPEAITDVSGIGESTLQQIIDYITTEE